MQYRHPVLPGIAERWGRSVIHCPFCHGWEVRERPLGVIDRGAHRCPPALLLRAWSDEVTLLTDGPDGVSDDEATALATAGVAVDPQPVIGLRCPDGSLTAVVFATGPERPMGALLVPVTLHQRSPLTPQLGATVLPPGLLAVDAVNVDGRMQTSVPGLAAAGDNSSTTPSVANAVVAASNAAAAIVRSLMTDITPSE